MTRYFFYALCVLCLTVYAIPDPTKPPDSVLQKQGKAPEFLLSAVIELGDKSTAIINGKSLGVGDEIMGSKVIKIEKTRVYLKSGSSITEITLNH
jgi:hypothetical protein